MTSLGLRKRELTPKVLHSHFLQHAKYELAHSPPNSWALSKFFLTSVTRRPSVQAFLSDQKNEQSNAPYSQHASAIASPEFVQVRLLGQQNNPVEHDVVPAGQLVDASAQPTAGGATMMLGTSRGRGIRFE